MLVYQKYQSRRSTTTRLNAGLSEIEPDLSEEKRDRWETNSVSSEDFIYGEYDGHHAYREGQEGPFGPRVRGQILSSGGYPIDEKHWVLLVLNFGSSTFYFFNSLRHPVRQSIQNTLTLRVNGAIMH